MIVDTGSTGLVIPKQDVNLANLTSTGITGSVKYGDSPNFTIANYTEYTGTVNFGNGIVTQPTTIDVVTSATHSTNGGATYTPLSLSSVQLIWGIGPNDGYPGTSTIVPALPGALGQGVLIDYPKGALEFGANPYVPLAQVSGAPSTTLEISINGGPRYYAYGATIDSGGLWGAVPQEFIPNPPALGHYLPQGDTISVYTSNGTLLYNEHVGSAPTAPYATSNVPSEGGYFNTGIIPFLANPMYLSYSPSGVGTMYFD